jgi:hypothetical protein
MSTAAMARCVIFVRDMYISMTTFASRPGRTPLSTFCVPDNFTQVAAQFEVMLHYDMASMLKTCVQIEHASKTR